VDEPVEHGIGQGRDAYHLVPAVDRHLAGDQHRSGVGLKDTKGALVSEPQKGSPAADAGVKSGDVVEAVNGTPVTDPRELSRSIAAFGPDKQVTLTIWRDGADKTIPVTLGKLPRDKEAKADAAAQQDKTELSSLGMTLVPSSVVPGGAKKGVTVAEVDQDGIAAQHGLSVGDVILQANGKVVSRPADITTAFAAAKQDGKPVLLRVKSGNNVHYLALAAKSVG